MQEKGTAEPAPIQVNLTAAEADGVRQGLRFILGKQQVAFVVEGPSHGDVEALRVESHRVLALIDSVDTQERGVDITLTWKRAEFQEVVDALREFGNDLSDGKDSWSSDGTLRHHDAEGMRMLAAADAITAALEAALA
jgi:hypothetical protein